MPMHSLSAFRSSFLRGEHWTVLAAVALALLAGCVSKEDAPPKAPATATAAPPSPVVQPVNLGSVINTKLREAEASFTGDGKTMYFNCQVRPDAGGNDICMSRLIGTLDEGHWTTPEIVAPGVISLTETAEVEPVISPDGKMLIFRSSHRPGAYGRANIWYSENVNGVWQSPKNLATPFIGPFGAHCLFFSADGNEAFWTSTRPGGFGGDDIWTSRKVDGAWLPAANLGPNVNSSYNDHHSILSPDGKSLYVTSDRPGGFGGEDIYVTTRDHTGAWGPLVNLGPLVNSDKDDRCPSFTPDFRFFVFDSERAGGYGSKDLWWVYYDRIKHIR
jgi:Tol biopolymer transport system component